MLEKWLSASDVSLTAEAASLLHNSSDQRQPQNLH
jgi:hypothetical protein